MALSADVEDFVSEALDKPDFAVRPENLRALRNKARASLQGMHTALVSPNAPYSWENRVIVPSAAAAGLSERIAYKFPQNMDVVGFNPILTDLGVVAPSFVPGNIMSALTDWDVAIDINNENLLTNLEGVSTSVGGTRGGNFISLQSIGILVPRLFALKLISMAPEIGMTFRSKRGANVFRDVMISVTMFVRRKDNRPSANVSSAAEGL
jgi:hypothetical protein